MKTLYDTLEIAETASPDVLAASHKALARRFHPDNAATGDIQRFRQVQAAWERLKDPASRHEYDRYLENARAEQARNADHHPVPALPIDEIVVRFAGDQLRERLGHIPGVREFIGAYEQPVRAAVRDAVGMATAARKRRRA
jgi:DnaJ-class molecular chaperone